MFCLGALDTSGVITECGAEMAKFPVEPQLARMLLKSVDEGCVQEAVILAAMLSTEVCRSTRPLSILAHVREPADHHPFTNLSPLCSPFGTHVRSLEKETQRPRKSMLASIIGWVTT